MRMYVCIMYVLFEKLKKETEKERKKLQHSLRMHNSKNRCKFSMLKYPAEKYIFDFMAFSSS